MELALLIWLIETVTTFVGMLQFILIIAFCAALFVTLMVTVEMGAEEAKGIKPYIIGLTIGVILTGMTPNKETAYTMLAAYGVQTVAENENVQEFMGDGLDVLQLKMKQYKQELLAE